MNGAGCAAGTALAHVRAAGPRAFAPRVSRFTQPFWSALEEGAFLLPRCGDCGRLSFPPKPHCPACGGARIGWQAACGDATVYSATTVHAAPSLFAHDVPYVLAVLDLAEGVRLVARWVGAAPACGAAARLVVLRHDDGVLFGATAATR